MAGKKKSVEELYEAIFAIRDALQDASQLAAEAAVMAEAFGGEISRVITNQLNSYFVPAIAKYIDDEETPGAMGPLVTFLDSVPLAMTRQEPKPEQTTPAPIQTELATPPTAAAPAEGSFAAQTAPTTQESRERKNAIKEADEFAPKVKRANPGSSDEPIDGTAGETWGVIRTGKDFKDEKPVVTFSCEDEADARAAALNKTLTAEEKQFYGTEYKVKKCKELEGQEDVSQEKALPEPKKMPEAYNAEGLDTDWDEELDPDEHEDEREDVVRALQKNPAIGKLAIDNLPMKVLARALDLCYGGKYGDAKDTLLDAMPARKREGKMTDPNYDSAFDYGTKEFMDDFGMSKRDAMVFLKNIKNWKDPKIAAEGVAIGDLIDPGLGNVYEHLAKSLLDYEDVIPAWRKYSGFEKARKREGKYDTTNLADANSYYKIKEPFEVVVTVGHKNSGSYYGSTQLLRPEYKKVEAPVGWFIMNLKGGTFLGDPSTGKTWFVRMDKAEWAPFEKNYGSRSKDPDFPLDKMVMVNTAKPFSGSWIFGKTLTWDSGSIQESFEDTDGYFKEVIEEAIEMYGEAPPLQYLKDLAIKHNLQLSDDQLLEYLSRFGGMSDSSRKNTKDSHEMARKALMGESFGDTQRYHLDSDQVKSFYNRARGSDQDKLDATANEFEIDPDMVADTIREKGTIHESRFDPDSSDYEDSIYDEEYRNEFKEPDWPVERSSEEDFPDMSEEKENDPHPYSDDITIDDSNDFEEAYDQADQLISEGWDADRVYDYLSKQYPDLDQEDIEDIIAQTKSIHQGKWQ